MAYIDIQTIQFLSRVLWKWNYLCSTLITPRHLMHLSKLYISFYQIYNISKWKHAKIEIMQSSIIGSIKSPLRHWFYTVYRCCSPVFNNGNRCHQK